MKKLFTGLVLFVLLFTSNAVSASRLTLIYDGEEHDYNGSTYSLMVNDEYVKTPVEPLLFNDYSLVPIREVCEAMGATVKYVDLSKQVYVQYDNNSVRLQIGNNTAYINSKSTQIPGGITPMLISLDGVNAKTMIPARFVSESLGFLVDFDGENGIIKINSPPKAKKITLKKYTSKLSGNTLNIELFADDTISSFTNPILTQNGVLYFDIDGAVSSLPYSNDIQKGAVKTMRIGMHETMARVALDVENCKKYNVELSKNGKSVLISVTKAVGRPDAVVTHHDDISDDINIPNCDKIVIIDAGHGGSDPGALGMLEEKTYYEKDINLTIAKYTADILKNNDITVVMTRDGDTYPSLTDRSDLANEENAVIFTSIHANSASSSTASGFEVYYSLVNDSSDTGLSSKELATAVIKSLKENVSTNARGIKTADHVVTRTCNMPAILIEVGFLTNPEELELMLSDEFQKDFARGIAEGIMSVISKANPPEIN